ncbi:MAG: tetratricopeptide repeat protein [Pseudomonadota bacterium]
MTGSKTLALALLFSVTFLAACDSAEERAEKHYQSALELLADGKEQQAVVELRNALQNNELHLGARQTFAEIFQSRGDTRNAFANYLFIVEQDPSNFEAMRNATALGVELAAWERVEEIVTAATEINAEDVEIRIGQLVLDYREAVRQNDSEARARLGEEARKLVSEKPEDMTLRKLVIDYLIALEDEREALAEIERALEVDPDDLSLYQAQVSVLGSLGEIQQIEPILIGLTERFPENDDLRRSLLRYYASQGDLDGAETFLRDLVADNPEDDEVKASLIAFLRTNRSIDAARAQVDTFIEQGANVDLYRALRAGIEFDTGDRTAAISEMQGIVETGAPGPQTRRNKVALARMLQATGNTVGSRALAEEVIAEDPNDVGALRLRAEFLIEADQADDAIVDLRTAMAIDPNDADLMTLMARAHERNGSRELMGEMLSLAAETSNYAPEETLRLATFMASSGRTEVAERALIDALRVAPGNAQLLIALATLYVNDENFEQAADVEDALRGIGSPEATRLADRIRLALLSSQENTDELLAAIDAIGAESGNAAGAAVARVRVLVSQGDLESAQAELEAARSADPDNLNLKFFEGGFLATIGQIDEAEVIFRELIAAAPKAEQPYATLMRILASQGRTDDAEAVVDEGIAQLPQSGNLRWAKAGFLERRGDLAGAISVYEEMYAENSNAVVIANNLASLMATQSTEPENIERAYAIARRLRGLEQPAFQDTYGWISFLRGDLNEALEHLEPAAAGLPGDGRVQYHLGRVYEAAERPDDARAQYNRALELSENVPDDAFKAEVQARLDGLN